MLPFNQSASTMAVYDLYLYICDEANHSNALRNTLFNNPKHTFLFVGYTFD